MIKNLKFNKLLINKNFFIAGIIIIIFIFLIYNYFISKKKQQIIENFYQSVQINAPNPYYSMYKNCNLYYIKDTINSSVIINSTNFNSSTIQCLSNINQPITIDILLSPNPTFNEVQLSILNSLKNYNGSPIYFNGTQIDIVQCLTKKYSSDLPIGFLYDANFMYIEPPIINLSKNLNILFNVALKPSTSDCSIVYTNVQFINPVKNFFKDILQWLFN
jgi:hypothetical protein